MSTWDIVPQFLTNRPIPIGAQTFDGSQIIPLVAALDTATWTLQLNLSVNFIHQLTSMEILATGANAQELSEWEPAMRTLITTGKGGVTGVQSFNFEMIGSQYTTDNAVLGFAVGFQTVAPGVNAFSRYFHPVNLPREPLDVSDAGQLFTRWFNASGSDTGQTTVQWHVKTLMYAIREINDYPLHSVAVVGQV